MEPVTWPSNVDLGRILWGSKVKVWQRCSSERFSFELMPFFKPNGSNIFSVNAIISFTIEQPSSYSVLLRQHRTSVSFLVGVYDNVKIEFPLPLVMAIRYRSNLWAVSVVCSNLHLRSVALLLMIPMYWMPSYWKSCANYWEALSISPWFHAS